MYEVCQIMHILESDLVWGIDISEMYILASEFYFSKVHI